MSKPKASGRQKGYIISLYKRLGVKMDMDDFPANFDTFEASTIIQNLLKELGEDEDPKNVQRKKIISMARTIGWEVPDPSKPGEYKADMARVYGWVNKFGYLKPKRFNQYNEDEIPALVTQFEKGPFQHKLSKK